ncbi:MAG: glycosyltransferase family 4 protein [Gemmatimonadaceae bacterium]|nr:glycosyltransferase family 4 protein [Gemmatimonadaceae bacterium]
MSTSSAERDQPVVLEERPPVAAPQQWCMITCEYPPMLGGVSDHSFLLARELARVGDTVEVWAPPGVSTPPGIPGVTVHVLPSLFGLDSLRLLRARLRELPAATRVLVQYVPTSFGWRMINLPFALFLYSQRRRGLDVYFHEVGFAIGRHQSMRRNVAGLVHVVMNWLTVRAASRVFVAIPEWATRLRRLGIRAPTHDRVVTWIPVPSNVPDRADMARVRALRDDLLISGVRHVVGHFGTYGRYFMGVLPPAVSRILDEGADRVVLLIGRESDRCRAAVLEERPDLAARVVATAGLGPSEVSAHIAACDVMLQPYDDGVSARRGSLMAALALGRAVISNHGASTGPVWTQRRSVLLTETDDPSELAHAVGLLLNDPERRLELAAAGQVLHTEVFALVRGVARLRNTMVHPRERSPGELTDPSTPSRPLPALVPRLGALLAEEPLATRPFRPRVLMLHTTLPEPGRKLGGVEVAVHRLANALVDLGVPVEVGSVGPRPSDARYAHRTLFAGAAWLRETRLGRLGLLPVLINVLRLRDTDVVHFHGDDWFTVWRPRATVRTLHGSALREAQQATRWQRRLVQYLVYPLERLSARLATVTVAVGEDAATVYGIRRVIGNGVDPAVFHPGEKADTPRILYVGTWAGRKRGGWLYQQFVDHVAPRYPDAELHFISDEAPPPHPRVRFERFPDDHALACAYREAWVFALPSSYEGFGIPYLEAMASGTAVLATPNPGSLELLGNGRFGVLADDAVYAEALLRLLRDDETRARVAEAGLEHSRAFSWNEIARGYLEVYDDAMRERAGATRAEEPDEAATSVASRELPEAGPALRRVRAGAMRGLVIAADVRWARLGDARLYKWLARALEDAAAMVDVGSGNGDAMIYALSRSAIRQLVSFEPDRARRNVIGRVLAPNGLATDPRLALSGRAVGASAHDDTITLDALIPDLRWPLVIRIAAAAVESSLDGAESMLAQDSTRWLVGVTQESRAAVERRFIDAGYVVHAFRTGAFRHARHWLAAWHADDVPTTDEEG